MMSVIYSPIHRGAIERIPFFSRKMKGREKKNFPEHVASWNESHQGKVIDFHNFLIYFHFSSQKWAGFMFDSLTAKNRKMFNKRKNQFSLRELFAFFRHRKRCGIDGTWIFVEIVEIFHSSFAAQSVDILITVAQTRQTPSTIVKTQLFTRKSSEFMQSRNRSV